MDHLDKVLQSLPEEAGKLVVVDGVFSMGGDLAPLTEMVPVCKKYGARIMVDDAHGMGVVGCGRGTSEELGVTQDVDLIMSTFSKSFASLGGFIAGDEEVVHYIKHFARALIFSASIPPANAAAALAALEVMHEEPERIDRVRQIGDKMCHAYSAMGFNTGCSATPIIPIVIGDDQKTFAFWRALFDAGVFVNPVISPAVPQGMQLLRTSYMATHTDQQLDRVLDIFYDVGKKLEVI
jgi:7-keto-8-aminopelargonate synthetase-like enzyme